LKNLLKLFQGSKAEEEILSKKSTSFKKKIEELEAKILNLNCWSEEQTDGFKSIKLQRDIDNLDTNLAGCEEEEKLFVKLQSAIEKNQTKDTVVISGWNVNLKSQKGYEFDFLIVSEPLKTIFQIEVKRTHTPKSRKSAIEQLQKGQQLFESRIPFPKEENWKYTKLMYFALNEKKEEFSSSDFPFCQKCQSYILGPATDFSEWWLQWNIHKYPPVPLKYQPAPLNRNIYAQAIEFLTFQMYIQEDCFTNQNLLDYTEEKIEKISTPEKLFFWSKVQYPLFNNSRNKRMVFISPFGTGKTTLLKAMARRLLVRREKVTFIFWDIENLLQKTYHEEFMIFNDQAQILLLKCKGNCFLQSS
jgi:DNA replication protein DnaC